MAQNFIKVNYFSLQLIKEGLNHRQVILYSFINNFPSGICYMSISKISKNLCIPESTLYKDLCFLEKKKFIIKNENMYETIKNKCIVDKTSKEYIEVNEVLEKLEIKWKK